MRYMFLVSVSPDAFTKAPPQRLMEEMENLMERATANGSLIARGGLMPGKGRVRFTVKRGKINIIDGPFAETKEVIGGFSIMDFASHEEALAAAKDFMDLHVRYGDEWEGTCEMIPFMGPAGDGDYDAFLESQRA